MATNLKLSIVARNAKLAALSTLANTGYIRVYDGSQPASPETAVSSQVKLVELRFNSTAFAAPSGGSMTANAIVKATIITSGTAAWFRVLQSDGTTVLWDGSVGTSASDLISNSVALSSGADFTISSLTYADPQ